MAHVRGLWGTLATNVTHTVHSLNQVLRYRYLTQDVPVLITNVFVKISRRQRHGGDRLDTIAII